MHRNICEPVTLKLTFDPRQLTFNVLYVLFLFPRVSLACGNNFPQVCSHQNVASPRSVYIRCASGFAIRMSTKGSSPTMHSGWAPTLISLRSLMPSSLRPGTKHLTDNSTNASWVGRKSTSSSGGFKRSARSRLLMNSAM